MRNSFVFLASVSVALILAGCSGKPAVPNPAGGGNDQPSAAPAVAPAVETAKPVEPPPSPNAAMRQAIKDWVDLAVKCDRQWVRKVDPSKLDKWELPVDVPGMEDDCDKLIFDHETLVKDNLFKGAALDSLFRRMAYATDLYSHLAFRCRKVGVKDRLPFKQMLAGLRDGLSAEIGGIATDAGELLALGDDQLFTAGATTGLIARADENLSRVASDMSAWVVKPRKEIGPVFKYSLIVSGRLAQMSSDAIAADQSTDEKYKAAAAGLAREWGVVSGFYAGDYLAEEEAKAGFLAKGLGKAVNAYEKAARAVRIAK